MSVRALCAMEGSETWIDSENRNFLPEFDIAGYQMFHQDRKGRRGMELQFMLKINLNVP